MIRDFPETGSAVAGGVIAQAVGGIAQTTLNYLDAFCVTTRCKEAKRKRKSDLAIAEIQLEAQQTAAQVAAAQLAAGKRTQTTMIVLGLGALGLGAWYLSGRR